MNIFLVLLSFVASCQSQTDAPNLYKAAYAYIVKSEEALTYMSSFDSSRAIRVFPDLVPLQISSFFEHFSQGMPKEEKLRLLDSLQAVEESAQYRKQMPSAELRSMPSAKNGPFVLFFCRPNHSTILAELFHYPKNFESIREVERFSRSILFLFEFDDAAQIKRVLTTSPQYE